MSPASPAENRPRRGLPATAGFVAVLGVLVAVTAAFGGLRGQSHEPLRAGPGHPVDVGLFRVVPLDARLTGIPQFVGPPKRVVVVRARVTNLGNQSWAVGDFLNGVTAEPTLGLPADPDVLDSTGQIDGGSTEEIHPRMPIDVRLVWALPKNAAPRTITVMFRQWAYGQSFTTDVFEWTVGHSSPIAAEISLPVRRRARS